jgi:TetR/AcrR family transcriptional regulator, mexJK operon transcriptional repressor
MNFSPPRPANPGRPKDPEKRAAILDAAQRLFPDRGYDGVSMDAIAQAAGVSKLTVYSHFDDKESLFAAAVTTCCEDLLPHRVFEPPDGQAVREVLVAIGRAFIDLIMDPRAIKLHQVMVAQAGQSTRLAEVFFSAGPRLALDEMESFLRHAHAAGTLEVSQPALAAAHFFCLLKGLTHMRVLVGLEEPPTPAEREAHLADVVSVFERAFAPRNAAATP